MNRYNKILNEMKDHLSESAQKIYKETKDKLDIKACELMNNEYEEENNPIEIEIEKLEKEIELEMLKQKLIEIKKIKGQDFSQVETMEKESVEQEMMEYKNDFLEMSIGSLKSIMIHAQNILNALGQDSIKENLTESWLQGKIAITEDYMITIHNFVMFVPSETDTEAAENRPGLWENIRKKRERMGKDYKPAKKGNKDRPDSEQWKRLTKGNDQEQ